MESASPIKTKILRGPPPEEADTQETLVKAILAGQQEEWGQGDAGYKAPKTPVDRMRFVSSLLSILPASQLSHRKGLPYKVSV
jgi:hypothetical protein